MIPILVFLGGACLFYAIFLMRQSAHEKKNFLRYFSLIKPVLASHRGHGKMGAVAENTIEAMLTSQKKGFLAHEFDVRMTRDGYIVLFHGPLLEKNSDGTGRLEEKTWSEVERLNAGDYLVRGKSVSKGKKGKTQITHFTRLETVLKKLDKRALLNVELKRDTWDFSQGLEAKTVEVIREYRAEKRVFFSSFHPLCLVRMKHLAPEMPLGLLIEPGFFARFKIWFYTLILLIDNIHLHYSTATDALCKKLKKQGYGLAAWTVNTPSEIRRLVQAGVDVVITDDINFRGKIP